MIWFAESVMQKLFRHKAIESDRQKKTVPINRVAVDSLNGEQCQEILLTLKPDFVILAASTILQDNILRLCGNGIFCAHPGIMPTYVGLSSIHWQIYDGQVPGYSIFKLTKKIDQGSVYVQKKVPILSNDTFGSYRARLSRVSVENLVRFIQECEINGLSEPLKLEDKEMLNRGLISFGNFLRFIKRWRVMKSHV